MSELSIKEAKKFLNQISSKDSIAIIHHNDADGFCSAILFNDFAISKGAKTKTFSYSHSKTKLSNLPLKPFNKIILTDISTKSIYEGLEKLQEKEIFLTDHHPKFPTPKKIKTFLTAGKNYYPSSKTAYELVGGKSWLALIGTIADAADLYPENKTFIEKILKESNSTLDDFKEKYSHIFSDTIIYFEKNPDELLPILSEIKSLEEIKYLEKYAKEVEKEIQKFTKQYKTKSEKIENISIYYFEPKFSVKGIVNSILSRENPNETIITLSRKNSNKNLIGISARSQNENANLPKLLEIATRGLENSNFGGHKRASGGQIQEKDLEKFKQNIKNHLIPIPNT